MINKDNCILLGTLAKPYGTKGSLFLRFSGLKVADIKKRELLFVEIDGLPVPFFIESFLEKSDDTAIVKFEGVESEAGAREFTGYPAYVMKDQVAVKTPKTPKDHPIQGYQVIDVEKGRVGIAGKILNIANNPLLTVITGDKEVLVPMHEDIIIEVNDREKVIRIRAPEGLLEL
jgi:16S rRNA processing protein RimM